MLSSVSRTCSNRHGERCFRHALVEGPDLYHIPVMVIPVQETA
jgi:hypothetical protein